MTFQAGGYAKVRGKTRAFKKRPLNMGDVNISQSVPLMPDKLLFLVESYIQREQAMSDSSTTEERVLWKVVAGEAQLWLYEDVLRLPHRSEVPEEAWEICGI